MIGKSLSSVWETNVFMQINKQLSIHIDDFENEIIVNDQLNLARDIFLNHIEKFPRLSILLTIIGLIDLAKKKGTGVFLFF